MDLFLLALFGCLLEGLVTKFGGIMLGTPTITISFLIVILAVTRWNLWGLIVIPFLAISTIIGGSFSDIDFYKAFYSFGGDFNNGLAVYISTIVGLSGIGLNVILFKIYGTRKIVRSPLILIGVIIADYAIFSILQFVSYRLISAGTLLHPAELYFTGSNGNTVNLAVYGENGFMKNLLALGISVVGLLVLRSQGVVTNVVDKLVDDRKNAELDAKDRQFRIEELEEKEEGNEELQTNDAKDELNDSSKNKI